MVTNGMSAYPVSGVPFHTPSLGVSGTPVPMAPTVSMKASAALMVEPALVIVAVTRTTGWPELSGSVPLFGFGAALTAEVTGPATSFVSVIVASGPQLPNASWLRTETVCAPFASAFTVAAGIVASRLAIGAATLTAMATAAPVSILYSAAAMFDPPVAVSLPVACSATFTLPLLGLGVKARPELVGPVVSLLIVADLNGPQLPAASRPWT